MKLCNSIGELKKLIRCADGKIANNETGEVLSVVKYPFEKWTKDYFEAHGYQCIFPMKAKPNVEIDLDISGYLEHKLDGTSTRCYITKKGLRFFGPRVVDKTDWVGEYTDKVIHLRDVYLPQFRGTILDGEFVHPSGIMPDRKSASILNPNTYYQTAWDKQFEEGWLIFVAYDVIRFRGADVTKLPYWQRLTLLDSILYADDGLPHHECLLPIIAVPPKGITIEGIWYSQRAFHNYIIENKMEGTVWCSAEGKYTPGKRTNDKLKFKLKETYDVVIMGFEPPTKEVDFSVAKTRPEDWKYWIDDKGVNVPPNHRPDPMKHTAVTKFYYYGWIGSVIFGAYDDKGTLVEVGKCSGMTEEVRSLLSRRSDLYKKQFKGNKRAIGQVIEVEGQLYDTEQSIRWPQFVRFRIDKHPKDCTLKFGR